MINLAIRHLVVVIVFLCYLPFILSLENVRCSAEYWFPATFSAGYNTVVRIPAGATSLDVRQHSFSGKSEDDNYLGKSSVPDSSMNPASGVSSQSSRYSLLPSSRDELPSIKGVYLEIQYVRPFLSWISPYWLKGYIIAVFDSKGFAPDLAFSESSVESWISWNTLKTSVSWGTDLKMFS